MSSKLKRLNHVLRAFARDDEGATTISFLLVFPMFMFFFGMVYENGMISARHVMLERGVDIAVRDVRIGRMANPTRETLRARICEVALIVPDCNNQLELEMVTRDPRNWQNVPAEVKCIDRGAVEQPKHEFTNGGNNQLVFLRACARFDPVLPTTGLGKVIVDGGTSASGGSYALVATSAFVVEPFRRDEDDAG